MSIDDVDTVDTSEVNISPYYVFGFLCLSIMIFSLIICRCITYLIRHMARNTNVYNTNVRRCVLRELHPPTRVQMWSFNFSRQFLYKWHGMCICISWCFLCFFKSNVTADKCTVIKRSLLYTFWTDVQLLGLLGVAEGPDLLAKKSEIKLVWKVTLRGKNSYATSWGNNSEIFIICPLNAPGSSQP